MENKIKKVKEKNVIDKAYMNLEWQCYRSLESANIQFSLIWVVHKTRLLLGIDNRGDVLHLAPCWSISPSGVINIEPQNLAERKVEVLPETFWLSMKLFNPSYQMSISILSTWCSLKGYTCLNKPEAESSRFV